MRWLLALASLLVASGPASAHDRDIATFVLTPVAARADGVKARGWTLDVHVARHALDDVLADGPPEAADPAGWRARAVAYLKAHVRLTHAGAPLTLGAGGIRVGGHQTDLRFMVEGLPPAGGEVALRIDAFAEDGHQSNVVKLRHKTPSTVVLGPEADFTATVTLTR